MIIKILPFLFFLLPATLYAGDGDSFIHEGVEYRLHGIDAPEYKQVCDGGWKDGVEAPATLND